jgi:hypothetical protein
MVDKVGKSCHMQDDVHSSLKLPLQGMGISEIIVGWALFSKSVCHCFKQDRKAENCVDNLRLL